MDADFSVHPDFKIHTGGGMTYGTGTPVTVSRKQKLNTSSSRESELVSIIFWTKRFMEAHGYDIRKNIIYQDNKSTILLETNCKRIVSNKTTAINIPYLFLIDQIQKGTLTEEYFPTTKMIAEFMSKPLQGNVSKKFRKMIMGHINVSPRYLEQQDFVGRLNN